MMLDQCNQNAIVFAVEAAASVIQDEATEPSVLYRPRVFIDGNKWCALYGENMQDGIAGFGDSVADAMRDFNANWRAPLRNAKEDR